MVHGIPSHGLDPTKDLAMFFGFFKADRSQAKPPKGKYREPPNGHIATRRTYWRDNHPKQWEHWKPRLCQNTSGQFVQSANRIFTHRTRVEQKQKGLARFKPEMDACCGFFGSPWATTFGANISLSQLWIRSLDETAPGMTDVHPLMSTYSKFYDWARVTKN